jgi:ureidoglycolate lyase
MLNAQIRLRLQPISSESFAPFGKLVEMAGPTIAVNEGTALRSDVDAFPADDALPGFKLVTSIYEAEARDLPQPLRVLERHVNSAQLIMPLGGAGHAVAVCLSTRDGMPELSSMAAFRCSAHQGVIYRHGLWHHPIAALGMAAQFLVQSWQDGTDADCEIIPVVEHDIAVSAHFERNRP